MDGTLQETREWMVCLVAGPSIPTHPLPAPHMQVVSFSCCDGLVYLLGYTGSV
jgi:hypothetical protein